MKRGPKPLTPDEKNARGTFQPVRDMARATITVLDPVALPQQPEWLTENGKLAWLDNVGRISSTRGATELDSDLFANYCNLQGAISAAWRAGEVPPVTALMEARKLQELLRLGGASSRVTKVGDGDAKPQGNPFLRGR